MVEFFVEVLDLGAQCLGFHAGLLVLGAGVLDFLLLVLDQVQLFVEHLGL